MKQIVTTRPEPENIIVLSKRGTSLDTSKFYGVLLRSKGDGNPVGRGMIGRHDYDGYLTVFRPTGFTRGNGWSCDKDEKTKNLTDFVTYWVNDRTSQVFQFDTFLELAAWLDEGGEGRNV